MATLTAAGVNFSDGSTINGTTANTVGSYCYGLFTFGTISNVTFGSAYAAGQGSFQVRAAANGQNGCGAYYALYSNSNLISGTWRYLGTTQNNSGLINISAIFVRIA